MTKFDYILFTGALLICYIVHRLQLQLQLQLRTLKYYTAES